ncbi:membrane protein YczE [Rhodococcus qingshengii]|jgi:uncharacterized membrane protein YczE
MDEQSSGHQDGRVLIRRFASLFVGLWLYGFSMAMMITAGLGLDPWDVFHQGVAEHVSLSFGVITAITGAVVLLLWIPIRQRPGFGTVANVVVISISVDTSLAFLPVFDSMPVRAIIMVAGILLNGLASVLYIGAGMGPGPRDGLMTGLVARTGLSVRLVRTSIEIAVLTTGWLLGGTVGVGTVLYAFGIGPTIQFLIKVLPDSMTAAVTGGRVTERKAKTVGPVSEISVPTGTSAVEAGSPVGDAESNDAVKVPSNHSGVPTVT